MTDAPLSKQAEIAQGVLERMLQEMAFPATVEVVETPDQITLTMVSEESLSLLVGKGGLSGNVLRIKPPLCITAADVDFALAVLDEALGKAAAKA